MTTATTTALDELRRIASVNAGVITAGDVVAAAKARRSPLHRHFEWDDDKAAHEYRLVQARALIRSVHVQLTSPDGESRTVRAFVHTATDTEDVRAYRPIEDVANDSDARAVFLSQLEMEWKSFRRRWSDYESVLSDLVLRDLTGDAA